MVASAATVEPKSLNLWKQQLGTVPASVCDDTALETLILADNGLTELPEAIGALTSLRTLDLGHNRLTRSARSRSAS